MGIALAALTACTDEVEVSRAVASAQAATTPYTPEYLDIGTRLLDGDLVAFDVKMKGARGNQDVADYAQCAASQYALIRGFGFARHLRTNVDEKGGVWVADAVYTISPSLPAGLKTIDAEVTVQNCMEKGIPTV